MEICLLITAVIAAVLLCCTVGVKRGRSSSGQRQSTHTMNLRSASRAPNNATSKVHDRSAAQKPKNAPSKEEKRVGYNRTYVSMALSLFRAASTGTANFVISPLSIGFVVSMLHEVSANGTKQELIDIGFTWETVSRYYKPLITAFSRSSRVKIDVACALLLDEAFRAKTEINAKLQKGFRSSIHSLNFRDGQASSHFANKLVSDATGGKIDNLVTQDLFQDDTMFLFVNCLYFKGDWEEPFSSADTKIGQFYGMAGPRQEHFMNDETKSCSVSVNTERTIVSMPYSDDTYSMAFIMPNGNFTRWKEGLSADSLQQDLDSLKEGLIELSVPKFITESELDCKAILKGLGIKSCFDPAAADFSPMHEVSTGNVFISSIRQKAMIDVNEKGTTAAAASYACGSNSCFTVKIRLDKPFIYMILKDEKTPMFVGQFV